MSEAFLTKDPATWCDDEDYKKARNIVSKLAVVNKAERGVALIQNFNEKLVKDEEQLQFLLKVESNLRNIVVVVRTYPPATGQRQTLT